VRISASDLTPINLIRERLEVAEQIAKEAISLKIQRVVRGIPVEECSGNGYTDPG
jgi:hypothetical protein